MLDCFFYSALATVLLRSGPHHKLGPQRQLVRRQAHGLGRKLRRHAFHLEQNLARPHHRHPVVQRALARAHADFGRLLGDRLVREQPQPDLAAALDETRHGDTAGLDLPVGDVTALHHLQTVLAERQRRAAPRLAPALALLLLAKLHFLWHQHNENPRKPVLSS